MVEREFMEKVDTVEECGAIVSKVGGRFCVATGRVTLGGRGRKKSKGEVHIRVVLKNVVQRSFGLIVAGGSTSWEVISWSEMKA